MFAAILAIDLGGLDYSAGFAAVIVGAIATPLLAAGIHLAYGKNQSRARKAVGYPLAWIGLLGLGLIAAMIVLNMVAPFAIAIWSLIFG
jgi:hypothetical protein